MIVERTNYFAKPGREDEVLAARRRASVIRRDLGLPAGRIFTRTGNGDLPDVTWECSFLNAATHEADLKSRSESAAFEDVRLRMRGLVDRFERQVFSRDDEPLPNGMRPVDLNGVEIKPRELQFPSDGRTLVGYLYTPPGEGPFPCLVNNHGSSASKDSFTLGWASLATLFMSWGIASFFPYRRGYGHSPGPHWREEVTAEYGTEEYDKQLFPRLDRESDDVIAALDCVSNLSEILKAHIGVIGSSFGGTNTLIAASKTDRFSCAIDFAGAAMNWDKGENLRKRMTEAAHRVVSPLFLIQAANDFSIRPTLELAEALKDHPTPVRSKIYPAFGMDSMEGHSLESRGQLLWADDVHRFLERYL